MASLEQLLERKLVFYLKKKKKVYLDRKLPGGRKKNRNKDGVRYIP